MKYILTTPRFDYAAGITVYDCKMYDYGLANEDTRHTSVYHKSVTVDPTGNYPFFTAPVTSLKEIL